MTLKQQLKPLSEVSLENAEKILGVIHGIFKIGCDSFNTYLYKPNSIEWIFNDTSISKRNDSGIDIEAPLHCYLRANNLGYYVPKLSEALKIKELEGELKALRYFAEQLTMIFSGKNPYDLAHSVALDIATLEQQIEELKQGADG